MLDELGLKDKKAMGDKQSSTRQGDASTKIPAKLLDLKFLIQLEQDGYAGALKYYKYFHQIAPEASANPRTTATADTARINEIKLLI